MKKIKSPLTAIFIFFICSAGFSQATEIPVEKPKYFAFGIRANTFSQAELNLYNLPPARLTLNVDPIKYLRVDLQIGFSNSVDEQQYNSTEFKVDEKTTLISGGLFGMYRVDQVNFYLGCRLGSIKYSNEYVYTPYTGSWSVQPTPMVGTNKGIVNTTYIVLGGEYFFTKRFSLSGEFGYCIFKDNFEPGPNGSSTPALSDTDITRITEAGILLRFYPF